MKNTFRRDDDDHPTGGTSVGMGYEITWQHGLKPKNGAFIEDIIEVAIDRLEFFQDSEFKCRENAIAITKLEEALHWLDHRMKRRIKEGTENTYNV